MPGTADLAVSESARSAAIKQRMRAMFFIRSVCELRWFRFYRFSVLASLIPQSALNWKTNVRRLSMTGASCHYHHVAIGWVGKRQRTGALQDAGAPVKTP